MVAPSLRLGPSGFLYPEWKGLVFPKAASVKRHALSTLSSYLDMVEIEVTAERALRPETAQVWLSAVRDNPRFEFTALLGRAFTHDRRLDPAAVIGWKQGLMPLLRERRLGAVVMQFPWGFRYTKENREFLIELRRAFHEFPLVAEFRHDSWSRDEGLGTLIDYHVGLVNVDQPEYFRAMPPSALLTAPVAYVRLHGRKGRELAQDFSSSALPPYLYNRAELEDWKPRIERLAAHAARTYVVATNAHGARSVVNTLQLAYLLGDTQRPAPPELLETYWRELAEFRSRRPVQPRLLAATASAA
jgi:uncharacterized protein YecE (DUF72 family)